MSAFAGGSGSQNTLTGPTNAIVCPGANVTLTGTAGGPTPYSFKWSKNGALLSGKTTNTLTLSNVSSNDAGAYALILTGGHNSVTNSATLTVRTLVSVPPMTNLVRAIGANALFVPNPVGAGPFTYVWQKNGANLA